MKDCLTKYEIFLFKSLWAFPIFLLCIFGVPIISTIALPFRETLIVSIFLGVILGFYLTFRFGLQKVVIRSDMSVLKIDYYNFFKTNVVKTIELPFDFIVAVNKYNAPNKIIKIKLKDNKIISFNKNIRFCRNDNFEEFWGFIKENFIIKKVTIQIYKVQLLSFFTITLFLSVIGLFFNLSSIRFISLSLLMISILMIMTLHDN